MNYKAKGRPLVSAKPKRSRGRPRKTAEEKHERKMQYQRDSRQGQKMAREHQESLDGLNTHDAF
jgi:hypothetical protein